MVLAGGPDDDRADRGEHPVELVVGVVAAEAQPYAVGVEQRPHEPVGTVEPPHIQSFARHDFL